MFKWPVCLVRVAWFASMACSLVNMPALMLVVRPLLCLLALAFLLNGTCVLVDSLLFLKLPMVGSLALPRWLCLKNCGIWCMLEVVAFVLRRSGCVLPCLAGACILMCCLPPNLRFFFLACKGSRALTWSTCRGSPAHAFDSWLVSQCFAWLEPDSWMEVDSFWFRLLFGSFFRRWHRSASACCWRRLACLVLASSHGIRATGCSAWLLAWCCWMLFS